MNGKPPTPEMMKAVFGVTPSSPAPPLPPPAPPPPPKPKRSVGDINVIAEGQRVFDPSLPPTQPKAPSAAMAKQGTAPAMDLTQPWGAPANG